MSGTPSRCAAYSWGSFSDCAVVGCRRPVLRWLSVAPQPALSAMMEILFDLFR